LPFVIFIELDLPPIEGNPMQKPWFKELLDSHDKAGVRDKDGKDFFNMIIFTNNPVDNPTASNKYPAHSYIASITHVPKIPLESIEPLKRIVSSVEKCALIPNWFDE
jgi:hypothetical protein